MKRSVKVHRPGDMRIVKRFLLLPKTLPVFEHSKEFEQRWLELASIRQRATREIDLLNAYLIWEDVCWEDGNESGID